MSTNRFNAFTRYISWSIALTLAWFSYFSFDLESYKWSILGVLIYLTPLLMLLLRIQTGRYYVILFTIAIALQSVLPSLVRGRYYTTQPNYRKKTIYEDGAVKGLTGTHNISIDNV